MHVCSPTYVGAVQYGWMDRSMGASIFLPPEYVSIVYYGDG